MYLEKVIYIYIFSLIVLRQVSYCHELESIVRDPSSLSSIQKLYFVLNRQKHDRQEKFLMIICSSYYSNDLLFAIYNACPFFRIDPVINNGTVFEFVSDQWKERKKNVDHRFLLRLLMCHKDKTCIYYVVTSRLDVYEDWNKTHMFKTLRIMSLRWTLGFMTIT